MRKCQPCALPFFCPVNVQSGYSACSSVCGQRKPLSLWRKSSLSTVECPFTITTSFIFLLIYVNRKHLGARAQVGQRICTPVSSAKKRQVDRNAGCDVAELQAAPRRQYLHARLCSPFNLAIKVKSPRFASVCGKTHAYPQHRMCRNERFSARPFFVQHPCRLDTMLFQSIRMHVNP